MISLRYPLIDGILLLPTMAYHLQGLLITRAQWNECRLFNDAANGIAIESLRSFSFNASLYRHSENKPSTAPSLRSAQLSLIIFAFFESVPRMPQWPATTHQHFCLAIYFIQLSAHKCQNWRHKLAVYLRLFDLLQISLISLTPKYRHLHTMGLFADAYRSDAVSTAHSHAFQTNNEGMVNIRTMALILLHHRNAYQFIAHAHTHSCAKLLLHFTMQISENNSRRTECLRLPA